jgi:hypothetical protein
VQALVDPTVMVVAVIVPALQREFVAQIVNERHRGFPGATAKSPENGFVM